MPRRAPPTAERKHYSKDLKTRVIYQAFTLDKSTTQIAIDLDMPVRVVQRVKQTWREIGEVCRDRRYIGRAPILSPAHSKFLLALLEHTPDMYLDEIQEALYTQHDLEVSLATISRTLKRLGFSSKKLSREAGERCEDTRREFFMEIGNEPPERLVCADESAVNILTTYRQCGWSFKGLRARKRCCFVRGTRYSLLPALTMDGIIHAHIKIGGYNGAQFLLWLDDVLTVMNPYPARHSVLILDNCRIHHVDGVQEKCDAA
ncbi:hypothetical protein R3P38DRAFT_3059166 [Favolaschia claudopus]|uniref:Transposase n=1 Tax=Favolaschia claudopus TaxID=2862362 RepID=A0AAW0A1R3_9AGAR